MFKKYLFFLFVFLCAFQEPHCPPQGSAKDVKGQALNRNKNRSAKIPAGKPQVVPLNMFITRKKGPDINKFREGTYMETSGYLIDYKEQGPESCNCKQASAAKKNGDIHMVIALAPDAAKKNSMVVEITPSYKKLHPNYSFRGWKGKKVKVRGYLLYDYLHEDDAINTCTKCEHAWRKTCWEIHPITEIFLEE